MKTRVQKWGNSLTLRIPKPLADHIGISEGSPVSITLRGEELVVAAAAPPPLKLSDLLAQVTEHNLHGEVDTEPAVGREAW